MSEYDYDLFVIGAGSGGVRASRIAAELGARVAVVESRDLGGTCVNVGCVPKKLFVYASRFSEEFQSARGYGWDLKEKSFEWDRLRQNKDKEIKYLNGVYQKLLDNAGVDIIRGHACLINSHQIEVADKKYTARHILLATGGWPFVPEFPGSDLAITSNEVFSLGTLPESIAIIGGGYIAVEFAGIFNGLGLETHLIYRGAQPLRHFDSDVANHAVHEMEKKGIQFHLSCDVARLDSQSGAETDSIKVTLDSGKTLSVGKVFYATGRKALTAGLGLENTSIELNEKGQIPTDKFFQTAEPNIFALGDVTGGIELTPVAIAEGNTLANNLFNEAYNTNRKTMDYSGIPTAVFCQPNIATVGLTEEQASSEGLKVKIFETNFRDLKHSLSGLAERTYMKLVVDAESDRVLGCHMVGQNAGEIIQGLGVAMKAGATKAHFDQCVGIHPTAAEEFVTMKKMVRES